MFQVYLRFFFILSRKVPRQGQTIDQFFFVFILKKYEKNTRFPPKNSKILLKNSAHRRLGASHNLPEGAPPKNPDLVRLCHNIISGLAIEVFS